VRNQRPVLLRRQARRWQHRLRRDGGGGLSTEPHIAQDLGIFITPQEALPVMESITRIFRDHGYRKNRKHARLKYLVADWGAEKFRAKMEEILGYKLTDAETRPEARGYEDRLGVYDQVQEGLQWVGVPVVAGRLTADQMFAIADIAQELGDGRNPPHGDAELLHHQRAAREHGTSTRPPRSHRFAGRKHQCGASRRCGLHRHRVLQPGRHRNQAARQGTSSTCSKKACKWNESEFFRINVNGCPNSCGQHWIADVGLQGCTKKVDGELKEHFDVFLGGALGDNQSGPARFNRRIKRVMAEEVAPTIQRAINHYQSNRQGTESFADYVARHSDEELAEII
jgi:ferredoxin-nitrite reductase